METVRDRPLVLIIEYEQDTANALSMLLEDWGFSYVVADSPDAVIRALGPRLKDIRALIIDHDLRDGVTGVRAAIAIANAIGHPVPTLLTSAFLERVEHLDTFPMLSKPFDPSLLHQWLSTRLNASVPQHP
jgi:CheY-like chemotaxis protein